jgi:toxin FitB
MKAICMDTSGWIEIAIDGANSKAFTKALTASTALIVSTISLYEISKYVAREVDQDAADELIAFIRQHTIIDVTPELALSAARLSAQHKLAMADSLIYATALTRKATLWTQDDDFKGLPHVKYFPKITTS